MSLFSLNRYVVSPTAPHPSRNGSHLESVLLNLTFGLQLSGNLFQILMNSKSSTFAGRYRLAEVLSASMSLLWVIRLSTHFVGKRNPTYSLTVVECFELAIELVKAYQAFVLPRVEQEVVDEEEE
jgi:predicted Co/Zn/Cd cation transporter (cation efflux family)